MHMGIPVCKRVGIAKRFAYGDPIMHNEIVHIRGLTYPYAKLRIWGYKTKFPICAQLHYAYGE